ncbi:MAG: hypothetical protein KF809_06325 [Chloroflexi bacterium]|nr:hypothetical protein [Chloroflexota bacterium]
MQVGSVQLGGHECLAIDAGGPRVVATIDAGPRVLSLTLPDGTGDGLLLLTPDLTLDVPGQGTYRLIGGHRLWAAPEDPTRTYLPDDVPVEVAQEPGSVRLSHPEAATGIRRTIVVTPTPDSIVLDHELRNEGTAPIRTAPWAITMCAPDGEAWLPRSEAPLDAGGYQANGTLVLWPYTRFSDPRLALDDPIIRVLGIPGSEGRVKVGLQGRVGWGAYRRAEALFVKRTAWVEGVAYPDMDASLQCYSCGDFVEVETLGPMVDLAPGAAVTHRETWSLHRIDPAASMADVLAAVGLA